MSLPRYKNYKDSGAEWLGEVPEYWGIKPLWALFRRTKRTGHEGEQLLSVYREYGVIPKASRDDNNNKPSDDLEPYQLVRSGDLVINKMKAWQGSVAISEHQGIVSPAYFVYEATHTEVPRYLHYLMRSLRYIIGYLSLSKGIRVNQWDLEPQYHSRMPIILPSKVEQTVIATFLDRETAKIDALVAEQQRLIELLEEKRQAVIFHAVTKGLNPTAPMKDSGIEWLGEVPVHWEVLKGAYLGRLFGSEQVPEDLICNEGLIPFLKVGSLSPHGFEVQSWDWFLASEIEGQYQQKQDFVVFPKRGAAIFMNKVNIVYRPALIDPNLMGWEISERSTTRFVAYLLKARKLNELADVSTVPQINIKHIYPERFPVPPVNEQIAIISFLDRETVKIEALTAEAQTAITLLQERRTALISATVTGKIDVRGVVAAQLERGVAA